MKNILIIDDDEAILESLQFLLEDEGFDVCTAQDGNDLDTVIFKCKPDLILMDYWLPEVNGGLLTQKLKSNPQTQSIPIIIISASFKIKDTALKMGADAFIAKPYDIDLLITKVNDVVSP